LKTDPISILKSIKKNVYHLISILFT